MREQVATLELFKQAHKFSAGHFTLFSPSERERLHGHDYFVSCSLTGTVDTDSGLISDYGRYKEHLERLCDSLDEYLLLPGRSPWLRITSDEMRVDVEFDGAVMSLPASDVLVLPVANISLECLAAYLLEQLTASGLDGGLLRITVSVEAGPGQKATAVLGLSSSPE